MNTIETKLNALYASSRDRGPIWSNLATASTFAVLGLALVLNLAASLRVGLANSVGWKLAFVAGYGVLLGLCLVNRARFERVRFGQITLLHHRRGEIEIALSPGSNWHTDMRALLDVAERAADSQTRDIWIVVRTMTFRSATLRRLGFSVRLPVFPMRSVYWFVYLVHRARWKAIAILCDRTLPSMRVRPWLIGRQRLGELLDNTGL